MSMLFLDELHLCRGQIQFASNSYELPVCDIICINMNGRDIPLNALETHALGFQNEVRERAEAFHIRSRLLVDI